MPENGFAEIYCESPAGLPTPRLWWEGPDGKVILSETSAFSESPNTLTLRNVNTTMTGNYTAVAENIANVTRASFQLIVTRKTCLFSFSFVFCSILLQKIEKSVRVGCKEGVLFQKL